MVTDELFGRRRRRIAERAEKIKEERLYRLSHARPKEFTHEEREELKHRHKYSESRYQSYRSLLEPFREGKLDENTFKKFKHAVSMKENYGDYEGYRRYVKKGLKNITAEDFKKADKFVHFGFGVPSFKAVKKFKNKGLEFLNRNEFENLRKVRGYEIPTKVYERARLVRSAKEKKLIYEKNGKIGIRKETLPLTTKEENLLRNIGLTVPLSFTSPFFGILKKFKSEGLGSLNRIEYENLIKLQGYEIPEGVYRRSRLIRSAKSQGLIREENGKLYVREEALPLTEEERELLRKIGFAFG